MKARCDARLSWLHCGGSIGNSVRTAGGRSQGAGASVVWRQRLRATWNMQYATELGTALPTLIPNPVSTAVLTFLNSSTSWGVRYAFSSRPSTSSGSNTARPLPRWMLATATTHSSIVAARAATTTRVRRAVVPCSPARPKIQHPAHTEHRSQRAVSAEPRACKQHTGQAQARSIALRTLCSSRPASSANAKHAPSGRGRAAAHTAEQRRAEPHAGHSARSSNTVHTSPTHTPARRRTLGSTHTSPLHGSSNSERTQFDVKTIIALFFFNHFGRSSSTFWTMRDG
jgi:hypothetical protein